MGTTALKTGEGVRVESRDGEVSLITAKTMPGVTSRSRVDLSACLFPCFRGRGGTSREGAVAKGEERGGPERGEGVGAEGAGPVETNLRFGELRVFFFNKAKNDPGPEGPGQIPSRTSKTNTNIQCFPFAMGQRGGQRARARCMRWVWNVG